MIVYMPHPNISYNFFMPIIAKRQPLRRPSVQSPPTIAAIFIFDVNADKVHCSVQCIIIIMHCVEWYMRFIALHVPLILGVKVLHHITVSA